MRPWRSLFAPAPSLQLELAWPKELEIRIAEQESDLERAFQLFHGTYVSEELMHPHSSGMRILPQQLLPQSSVIVALWQNRILGAVSLIRDNPLGLPIEQIVSLAEQREGGRRLAEMSLIALDPLEKELHSRIRLPLFRFIYQYAFQRYNVQTLILEAAHDTLPFYRDTLLFQRSGFRSPALVLDLETASELWKSRYEKEPEASNLAAYLATEVDDPGCKFPDRTYGIVSDLRLTPQLLEKLYLRKAGLLNTLRKEEVRVIQDAYPHAGFDSILRNLNWVPDGTPKREIRLDALMTAQVVEVDQGLSEPLQVRNISRHGLQLWSKKALKANDVINLQIKLNDKQSTQICALVKWTDASGHSGLRILSYSSEWSVMLQSIEGQLARLATSK
jgi:hypothetical protein